MQHPPMENIGIIAGYGLLPEIFVDSVKDRDIYVIGFKKYISRRLLRKVKKYKILNSWNLTETIKFFNENNVNKILFLGYIPHTLLFQNPELDEKATGIFSRLKTKTAMQIFHGLSEELASSGIVVEPINKYLTEHFAEKGVINSLFPTEDELKDIEFGYQVAKHIASLDIGLTVVVKYGTIIAVEALEGTDNCIYRAAKLAGKGCRVVKVARPQQDMRFDLPVIGPKTIKVLSKTKSSLIAVESGTTLILEKNKVIQESKKLGIKLYGI